MTIEIQNPELEAILQQRLEAGNFSTMEELLLDTFQDFKLAPPTEEQLRRAREAAVAIAEIRKDVKLERPEGMSLREYAHIGHRY